MKKKITINKRTNQTQGRAQKKIQQSPESPFSMAAQLDCCIKFCCKDTDSERNLTDEISFFQKKDKEY